MCARSTTIAQCQRVPLRKPGWPTRSSNHEQTNGCFLLACEGGMPVAVYQKVGISQVLSVCAKSRASLVVLRPPLCAVAFCAVHYNKAIHLGRNNNAGDLSAVRNMLLMCTCCTLNVLPKFANASNLILYLTSSPDAKVSDLWSYFLFSRTIANSSITYLR